MTQSKCLYLRGFDFAIISGVIAPHPLALLSDGTAMPDTIMSRVYMNCLYAFDFFSQRYTAQSAK